MVQTPSYGKSSKPYMIERFQCPEGATPISDCSGLIPLWVHHSKDLNRIEAENIAKAQRKYFRRPVRDPKTWFHMTELKAMHRVMFGEVWDWAGAYRKSNTSIGIKPNLIPAQLAEFCQEVLAWLQYPVELTFVEMAARIHHRLVFIHPFENGNGRFSRLVADRFLFSFSCPYPMWPQHLQQEGIARKEYIQTLRSADRGDYTPLIALMVHLGASDPSLSDLIRNKLYKAYIAEDKGLSTIRALLRNGGNPNDQTPNGHRVLQLATKAGLDEIVHALVAFGAEVDAKDRSGLTAFQVAVMQNNKALADFLASEGAERQLPPG